MRKSFLCFSLVMLCGPLAPARPPAEAQLDRLRELVEAGAAPRAALDRALAELEDQADNHILRETLYSTLRPEDTTPEQLERMLAAAQRRVDRKQKRVDELKPLIEEGIVARAELTPHLEELDFRKRTLNLALSRARFLEELNAMARAEQALENDTDFAIEPGWRPLVERFQGSGQFERRQFKEIVLAFEQRFARPIPVSADGDTALHRALGFDHRGRVDVAVAPDTEEGRWLIEYLKQANIPFYAIRGAVDGRSTGAHIHIGPPSLRLRVAD